MVSFFVVVIGVGWVFSYVWGNAAILYGAVFLSIAMNIGSYWYSHKIVLAVSGAHKADERQFQELHRVVENLSITAGLPKPAVYIMNDPAPNAFATGRNKEHAVVAVTTGLLSVLEKNELEGVLAHELSHIGNRDMLVSTIAVTLVGFITLLSDFFLRSMFWGGGNDRDNRMGLIITIAGIVLAIAAPLIATLIRLAVSRKREFLADASGVLLTRYPEGLANALRKISAYAAPMRRANHATAHLFIADPFGLSAHAVPQGIARGLNALFMTHPPAEERIRALVG